MENNLTESDKNNISMLRKSILLVPLLRKTNIKYYITFKGIEIKTRQN